MRNPDGSWSLPMVPRPLGILPSECEWADYTFEPLRAVLVRDVHVRHGIVVESGEPGAKLLRAGRLGWGCAKTSAGCQNCRLELTNMRLGTGLRFQRRYFEQGFIQLELDPQRVELATHRLPEHERSCRHRGAPRVSVADGTDLFGEYVPFGALNRLFDLFEHRMDLEWMLMTKFPERARAFLDGRTPSDNVWVGTSVETQDMADPRVEQLQRCRTANRFVVCEPLLDRIHRLPLEGIDWVHVGGEWGDGARQCDLEWMRGIIARCQVAKVPCFVKQLGARPVVAGSPFGPAASLHEDWEGGDLTQYWPPDLCVREHPNS